MKKLLNLLLLLFIGSTTALAETYYVNSTGSNANDGTSNTPWQTIAYAISQIADGDTLMLSGVFTEQNILITKDVVMIGDGVSSTILQAQTTNPHDENPRNPLSENRMIRMSTSGKTLTLKDLTLRYGNTTTQGGAIYASAVADINIIGCNIADSYAGQQGGGISTKGNLTIENSAIINNVSASHGGGVYVSATTKDLSISNSLIYNNTSLTQQGGGLRAGVANLTLNNNTIAFNKCDLINKIEGVSNTYAGAVTLTNNIFFNHTNATDNKAGGEDFGGTTPASIVSRNNIFSYVANNIYYNNANPITTASNNFANKANVTEALLQFGVLIEGQNGVYGLPVFGESIAVDAGDSSSATATDMYGTTRTTPDIGAFETGGSFNLAPAFISPSALGYAENKSSIQVEAIDSQVLTYSMVGGVDQGLFTLTADGLLSFNGTPSMDNPTDANGDNTYEVEITIEDGLGKSATRAFSITVTPAELNVMMIVLDDLNDYIGVMGGHPQAKTPNIDKLAGDGVLFTNAHSNAPLCNPSRASFLNGILPSTSGLFGTSNWNQYPILTNSKIIPEYMRDNGYTTYKTGKISHSSSGETKWWDNVLEDSQDYGPVAFDGNKGVAHSSSILELQNEGGSLDGTYGSLADIPNIEGGHNGWWSTTRNQAFRYVNDNDRDLMPDEISVNWIKQQLETLSANNSTDPFMMAAGLIRPHSPFVVPQKYFDMFPLETIEIPQILLNDLDDFDADTGGRGNKIFDAVEHSYLDKQEGIKRYLQGYLASIAFADEMVGQLLDALENSNYADNTVVILFSDHGYNMGEKNYAWKNNLWDNGTKVPLIIKSPMHKASAGSKVNHPVSLVDVYPTINDLCSLTGDTKINEEGAELDGHSLKPFLQDPVNGTWEGNDVALSEVAQWFFETPSRQNYSLRSKRFRYTSNYKKKAELYDYQYDSDEWVNVIDEPAYAEVKEAMEVKLEGIVNAGLIMVDELEDFSKVSEHANLALSNITNAPVGDVDQTQMVRESADSTYLIYEVSGLESFYVEMWNTINAGTPEDVGTIKAYVAGSDKQYTEVTLTLSQGKYTWSRNILTFKSTDVLPEDTAYLKITLVSDDSVDFTKALLGEVRLMGDPTPIMTAPIDDIVVNVNPSVFEIAPEYIRSNEPMLPFFTDSLNNTDLIYSSTGCTYIAEPDDAHNGESRLVRCSLGSASITYNVDELDHFRVDYWTIANLPDWDTGTLTTYVAGEDEVFVEVPHKSIAIQSDYTKLSAIVPAERLPEGVKYFRVELSAGTNAWSAQIGTVHLYTEPEVTVTPPPVSTGAVSIPSDINITANSTNAFVSFTEGNNADYHKIQYRIVGKAWVQIDSIPNANVDIYELVDLQPSTDYMVRIRAFNSTHISSWSSQVGFTTTSNNVRTGIVGNEIQQISIYPNPVNEGNFTIHLGEIVNEASIVIYNALGKIEKTDTVMNHYKMSLNSNDFAKGLHIVKIVADNKVYTKQLIIR